MERNKTALNQRQFRLDITKNFLATRMVIQRNSSKGNWESFFTVIKKKKEKERKEEKKERKKRESFPQFSQLKLSSLLYKYFYWCHFYCIGCQSHPLSYSFVLAKRDCFNSDHTIWKPLPRGG